MEKYKDKKIAIVGFGIEGQSVANFLLNDVQSVTIFDEKGEERFPEDEVYAFREKGITLNFGEIPDLEFFDIIFRSPGIKPTHPKLVSAKEKGSEIISSTKLFFELCPAKIIGVTGTKGKGTTSTLIYEMLKLADKDVYLGGNIGTPPLSFLNSLDENSIVVLELSSFQLIDLDKSPHIAVVLMTTSEHLDYHSDVYEYIDAKRNILRFQKPEDFAVVNKDYPASNESDIYTDGLVYKVSREQEVIQGSYIKDDSIFIKMHEREEEVIEVKEIYLPGRHNLENVGAAVLAATIAGANMKSIVEVLKTFKGLEHRIEFVRMVQGVKYYDDSFSTTPETAIAAIEAFEEPKIMILGGSSKNSDFTELGKVISELTSIKTIIGIGEEWERIKAATYNLQPKTQVIEGCKSMEEIVAKCAEIGEIGDVVLLSPACASFDMFNSYKDRGEQFKKEVGGL